MKQRFVSVHPAALDEALAAGAWYATRSRQASEAFWDEIDRTIARIEQDPEQFAPLRPEHGGPFFADFRT